MPFSPGQVISYMAMCTEEQSSLQRGMNFRLGPSHSVILMSVRNWFPDEIAGSYRQAVDLFPGDDANSDFRPVAGKPPHRPRWIYRPTKATGQE